MNETYTELCLSWLGRELNINLLGITGQTLVSIQDLRLYMPYLQALLSEFVKLMFHSMSQA